MNTPVSFELAKLLEKKGFDGNYFHYWNMVNHSGEWKVDTSIWEYTDDYIEAPTIAEVVMWLYEKHEIWIEVRKSYLSDDFVPVIKAPRVELDRYKSPIEAYEAAIEYTLKNLL